MLCIDKAAGDRDGAAGGIVPVAERNVRSNEEEEQGVRIWLAKGGTAWIYNILIY